MPIGEAPPDGLEQLRLLAVRFERDLRHTLDDEIRCSAFEDGDHLIFRAICPIHPDSTHSLTAKRFGRSAWWVCPSTGERTTPVGTLGDPTDEPTRGI
jgi:hypothetical protein